MLIVKCFAGCMYGCMRLASRIAVNTTLAAAAGGLTSLFCETLLGHPGDISPILNGILAGEPCCQSCLGAQKHHAVISPCTSCHM